MWANGGSVCHARCRGDRHFFCVSGYLLAPEKTDIYTLCRTESSCGLSERRCSEIDEHLPEYERQRLTAIAANYSPRGSPSGIACPARGRRRRRPAGRAVLGVSCWAAGPLLPSRAKAATSAMARAQDKDRYMTPTHHQFEHRHPRRSTLRQSFLCRCVQPEVRLSLWPW